MSDLGGFSEIEALRSERDKALREADKQRKTKAALVEAVHAAVTESLRDLRIPAVPKPAKDARAGTAETAICLLSDWQLAKLTPSYDSRVCEKRVEEYAQKVIDLTNIQRRDHPVREVRVYLLGDLVEGELIFPGQAHRIDASLYRQVVVDGPRILAGFLRRMLATFDKVHVVGVIGNHGSLGGRARKDYHPESNADAMMYEVTRLITQSEARLTWAPNLKDNERNWFALDRVGSKTFFLFHGDQVKGGFAGFPWYGFGKKLLAWRDKFGFDYSVAGHFHTPVRFQVGGLTHWGNGTTESENTWALETLGAQGDPSQWVLYVHPKRGTTAEYEIRLS